MPGKAEIVNIWSTKKFVILKRNGDVHLFSAKKEVPCLCPPLLSGNSQRPSFFLGNVSHISVEILDLSNISCTLKNLNFLVLCISDVKSYILH